MLENADPDWVCNEGGVRNKTKLNKTGKIIVVQGCKIIIQYFWFTDDGGRIRIHILISLKKNQNHFAALFELNRRNKERYVKHFDHRRRKVNP